MWLTPSVWKIAMKEVHHLVAFDKYYSIPTLYFYHSISFFFMFGLCMTFPLLDFQYKWRHTAHESVSTQFHYHIRHSAHIWNILLAWTYFKQFLVFFPFESMKNITTTSEVAQHFLTQHNFNKFHETYFKKNMFLVSWCVLFHWNILICCIIQIFHISHMFQAICFTGVYHAFRETVGAMPFP